MSSFNTDPRFRINAKQNSKNYWTLEAPAEYKSDKIQVSNNPNDPGETITNPLGLQLLSLIKETEKHFRADGRRMVGDDVGVDNK